MIVLGAEMRGMASMQRAGWILVAGLGLVSCGKGADPEAQNQAYDYTAAAFADSDSKALIYNLIGRWFPESEIKRLDDDSMTPEAWCAREPSHVRVHLDEVVVQCDSGPTQSAAIARVVRHESGGIQVVLRASDDAPLKSLLFEKVIGTKAEITGSPCGDGKKVVHARFPKIEILRRQILGGRRCAQVQSAERQKQAEDEP